MLRVIAFCRDLYRDGWGFVGIIAPAVSIIATIFKLLDVDMQWLRDLSWGWVFAPVAAWLLIAYVRRWMASQASIDCNPNWSAKDAFRYLMVDSKWALKKNPDDGNIYIDVEGSLRDKARLGRLTVWARPKAQISGGLWKTMKKIGENEWDDLTFDLVSCVSDMSTSAHLVDLAQTQSDKYEDAHVNKEQMFFVWPEASFWERHRDPQFQRRIDFFEKERCGYSDTR